MSRFSERRVARLLTPGADPRPPVGLASRIKDEIPADVRLDPDAVARIGAYRPGAHRRFVGEFVLLAVMLLVVVGLGVWGLKAIRDHEDAARHARAVDALLEPGDDWGRGRASLTVTVRDERGIGLPGARVVLHRLEPPSLASRRAETAGDGRVRFLDLPPGGYRVSAELPGFEPAGLGTVRVREERGAEVSLELRLLTGSPPPAAATR
jgi:hypothetical protein